MKTIRVLHAVALNITFEPVHAGVECGAFAEKNSELDMIAIGPTLIDVHTPGETCDLKAVEITTELLIEIVKRLTA